MVAFLLPNPSGSPPCHSLNTTLSAFWLLEHRYSFSSSPPFLSCRTSEQTVEQELFCKWQFRLLPTARGCLTLKKTQQNSVASGIPLPSLSTATQAGACCNGSQHRTAGGTSGTRNRTCRHLLSPPQCPRARISLCRTCHTCCTPLPFTLGAEGLNHAARPAFFHFPLWALLSPPAIPHPPSLCSGAGLWMQPGGKPSRCKA